MLLFAGVIYTYNEMATALHPFKALSKEKRVCIQLGKVQTLSSAKPVVKESKKVVKKQEKKEVKKSVPKVKKKEAVKKPIKKSVPLKKEPKKKKTQPTPPKPKPLKQTPPKTETKQKEQVVQEQVATSSKISEQKPKEIKEIGMPAKEDCPMVCCDTTVSAQQEYKNNNLAKIAQLLKENLYYPRRARKRGIEGEVKVSFVIHKDAQLSDIKVLSSSSDILSRAAIKTLENLSGKFPKPSQELTLTVPIGYYLTN
jgi:protein TonB